ncbi:MAG: hypothetical protein P8179_19510 [Candidatus Thiodiazotropha sp.]
MTGATHVYDSNGGLIRFASCAQVVENLCCLRIVHTVENCHEEVEIAFRLGCGNRFQHIAAAKSDMWQYRFLFLSVPVGFSLCNHLWTVEDQCRQFRVAFEDGDYFAAVGAAYIYDAIETARVKMVVALFYLASWRG